MKPTGNTDSTNNCPTFHDSRQQPKSSSLNCVVEMCRPVVFVVKRTAEPPSSSMCWRSLWTHTRCSALTKSSFIKLRLKNKRFDCRGKLMSHLSEVNWSWAFASVSAHRNIFIHWGLEQFANMLMTTLINELYCLHISCFCTMWNVWNKRPLI